MRIGISGGSGDLSRRIVAHLIETGFPGSSLVIGTRTPSRLESVSAPGIEVRHADFSEPRTVSEAFGDCDRVLLMSIEDPLFDLRGKEFHANAIAACADAGIPHIMYTSAVGAFLFGDGSPYDVHADAEWHLQHSGFDYTVIRNGFFAEMIEFDLRNAIRRDEGIWVTTAGNGVTAWICKDDIARSTAAILRTSSPSRLYTLTGERALGIDDVVRVVNERFGTNIVHESLTPAGFDRHYDDRDRDKTERDHLRLLFCRLCEGHCSVVTNDVERMTGRKPSPFIQAINLD